MNKLRIRLDDAAQAEYEEAVLYYRNISRTLAHSFVHAIKTARNAIKSSPRTWNISEEGIRKYNIKQFPYTLFYRIEEDCIVIYAVMHQKRKPGYWKERT